MTKSKIFIDPNMIVKASPTTACPKTLAFTWDRWFFILNHKPMVFLPATYIGHFRAGHFEPIFSHKGHIIGLKVCSLRMPTETRWIGLADRGSDTINWNHVVYHDDGAGNLQPYERALVRSHGAAGLAECSRLVNALHSPDCNLLFRTVLALESPGEYKINPNNDIFTRRFGLISFGNPYMDIEPFRQTKKKEWFCALADLNHSVAVLDGVSSFVEDAITSGRPAIGEAMLTLQHLVAQLVRNNIQRATQVTLSICWDRLPSRNIRFTPTNEALAQYHLAKCRLMRHPPQNQIGNV